jgi:filamentous hemagglutinin
MNKQRHRLVFNARRAQVMAVAETASSIGEGSSGERAAPAHPRAGPLAYPLRHIALHPLSLSIGLALALVLSTSAQAQIIADPSAPANQRPTVHSAANGVPLVNIQTPTAGGVSRNTYRQFDVQSNGVILNNSRTQVQTQLGGWVAANPWLVGGSARIIVNEVNSSNPSLLQGFVEVAGQQAQVIISNPSGIQVQGGGFINASRATLTTGKPVFHNDTLEGFRVQGGTITIDGAGLDTSSTDYTAVLARAVQVNAGIWAQELKVVTGANEISADLSTLNANPSAATGSTPTYALDVAQLGGMYAGKIHLVGTESGVGVNLRGVVGATSGDVVIHASGRLHAQGTLQASGLVRVQTKGDVRVEGDVYAGGDLSVSTTHTLSNSAELRAQGDVDVDVGKLSNEQGARIVSASTLRIASQGDVDNAGQIYAAGSHTLNAAGALTNSGLIAAGGHTNVTGQTITNTGSMAAGLNTDGTLKADVANLGVQAGARLTATGDQLASGDVSLRAQAVNHAGGQTQARRDVTIEAGDLNNIQSSVVAGRNLSVTSAQKLLNHGGLLSAGETLTIADAAATADPSAPRSLSIGNTGGTMIANGHLGIEAANLGLDGQLLSRNTMSLKLDGDHQIAQTGVVLANNDLDITLDGGDLTNDGTLQAGRLLQANARNITNNATGVISAETTRLRALQNLVNRGLIDGATTDVRAHGITNTATGRIYGQDVRLQAQANLINEGNAVVAAHNSLHIGVGGELTNQDGATLLSLGELAVGGALDADGKATGAAQAIQNRSASIESGGDMRLSAGELNNVNDQLEYKIVPEGTTSRTDYYLNSLGYVGSEDVAWTAPMVLYAAGDYVIYWPNRVALLLKSSPYADPMYRSYFVGPTAFVPEHYKSLNDVNASQVWVPDTFNYAQSSPIWQALGMTAPAWEAPGQRPQPREGVNNTEPPDPQAVAAWQAKAAPWFELNNKIAAFKNAVNGQLLGYDIYRNYTETTHSAEVTASQPARILSGGNLQLLVDGTALNKDSTIVAGGGIQVVVSNVTNQSTEVNAPTLRSGTFSNWAVLGQSCDLFGCDPIFGWATAPYAETINRAVSLASVRYEQNTQPPAISQQPGALQTGQTTTQASGVTAPTGQAGAPNLTLPSSALYQLHPDTTSGYLVETDPRFTDRRQWLSSDYMLAALSVDPATAQKRMGDGYYEQRLVREQVAALTGHRFLGDHTSDEQQYQALMNAGATFAQAHELRPGIELSAAQVAALTSDIVWLVERNVRLPDGSTTQALVPQIYVRPQVGDLQPSGALLAGKSVNLSLSEDLTNTSGTIAGRQVTQINAQNVHNLGGLISSGQTTAITAAQDIRNVGGTIGAQDALALDAGRDLSVQTTTTQGSGNTGVGVYSSQGIDRVAALYVSNPNGTLQASAGRDVNLTAALVQSEGSVQIQAGRDIALQTVQTRTDMAVQRDSRNYAGVRQSEEVGTRITSEGSTSLSAGQDIRARAAQGQAQGELTLQAGRDVQIEAGQQSLATDSASYAKGRSLTGSSRTEMRNRRSETNAVASNLSGEQVTIQSGQDTTVQASRVAGDQGVSVSAGRDVNVVAGRASSESLSAFHSSKSGMLSSKSNTTQASSSADLAVGSSIDAQSVEITAGQDIAVKGSSVNAQDLLLFDAGRDIAISSEQNHESGSYFSETKKSGFTVSKEGIGYGKSAQDRSGISESTTQAGSTASGGDVLLFSGRDSRVEASTVVADDMLGIEAGRDVSIVAGVNTETSGQTSNNKSKGINLVASGLTESVTIMHDMRQSSDGTGRSATAAASTVGSLEGEVTITAAQKYQQTGSDVLALEGDIDIQARQVEITEAREAGRTTSQQSSKSTVLGATPRNPLVDAIQGVKSTAETALATAQTGNGRAQALGAAATALSAYNTANQVADLIAHPEKIASVTIDFNLSSSKSQSQSTETADSGRASAVAAAGDVRIAAEGGGAESDLLVRGSDVSAGNNATFKAEGDVQLESSQDISTLHSTSQSSGASIGVGVSFGASNGITFNASANKARGNGDGEDVVQRNTHIVAGDTARIESGADTTLAGATVSANTVQAEVGGDLNIESRQDTGQFKSDQNSSGWGVSLCIPPFCYGASSVSISGGAQNIDSEFASVTEQSGLRAGDGGFQVNVQNDTTLTGGAITSTDQAVQDDRNSFATGGELKLSDVENHAEFKGDGYSVTMTVAGGGPDPKTLTPEQKALAPATPAKNAGSAGIGEDSGSASSTTHAAISGIAGNTEARTGDAETGIAPIFDRERVQREIDAQVRITAEFGKQASQAIGDYATKQYNELKATDPEEAAKWAEGGIFRSMAHAVVGGLTGGAAGAAGAGLAALSADAINQLTEDMPDGVKNMVGAAVAAGIGAIAGGTTGAATAFNADMNNRQLHPSERAIAKKLAAKSDGKYTAEEIENALRNAGNTKTGESVVAGMVVDPAQRDAIYDAGAVWTTGENGWLVQVLPPQPDAELTTFIRQNTGETYNWYTPSTGGLPNDPNMARDRLTGQPLDEKGRYSQRVILDGKAFEPKYFQCATTECMRTGANLDVSDPASQAYIRALDAQIFKDMDKAATVGTLVTPIGVPGAVLTAVGLLASGGQVATSDKPTDVAIDEAVKEISELGAVRFFEKVLGHTSSAAARASALINLGGGWDAFSERVRVELLGMKSDEKKK